jgi:hypothetical protein
VLGSSKFERLVVAIRAASARRWDKPLSASTWPWKERGEDHVLVQDLIEWVEVLPLCVCVCVRERERERERERVCVCVCGGRGQFRYGCA